MTGFGAPVGLPDRRLWAVERNDSKLILVTGAAGFVGSAVVAELAKRVPMHQVVLFVFDAGRHGPDSVSSRAAGAMVIRGDLVTGAGLDEIPAEVDTVIHLATNPDTGAADQAVNDLGTENLLGALGGRPVRMIFTSSVAVSEHRRGSQLPTAGSEFGPPRTEYGRSKLRAEALLLNAAASGLDLSILRLPVVYGDAIGRSGFVAMLSAAVEGNSAVARVRWPGRVGLIAVQDVAAVLCSLALAPGCQPTPNQSTPGYLVAEVRAIGELFESAAVAGGRRYRQLKLPSFGWRAIRGVLAMLLHLEGRLPARFYNSIWQLTMMCGDGLAAEPSIPEGMALQHRHIDLWLHQQAPRRAANGYSGV